MSRLIAIGDIHGCLDKLNVLIDKIHPTTTDTLVFLGDYIDRGPDSKGVINRIIELKKELNVVCLLGNHELMAIESFDGIYGAVYNHFALTSWLRNGGFSTLCDYDLKNAKDAYYNAAIKTMFEEHGNFLRSLQLIYETENHIFVHGYLNAEKTIDEQITDLCVWSRFESIRPHISGKTVVCGHTIQEIPMNLGNKICIDTGSFKPDGYITALVIDGAKQSFITSK